MTEVIDSTKPEGKVYLENAFRVGTFFGGPLVGAYMMAENFKAIGQREKVTATWLIAIGAAITIFAIAFSIPDNVKIPNVVFPLVYTLIGVQIYKKYQESSINNHLATGGEKFGWFNITLICIIGLVVTIAPILFITIYGWN